MNRLYYGIKEGKIVSINEVCSGIDCDCVCPSCGEILIAKKGKIKIHHFAHLSKKECEYGYESTLHILAKDIIKKAKHFVLPEEFLCEKYFNREYIRENHCKKLSDAIDIEIDDVKAESNFDDLKPDIVIYKGSNKYFIEIFVTHKIDDEKREKIKNKRIDTIEIDLSHIDKGTDYAVLEKILLNNDERKYWVYNNKVETEIKKIEKNCSIPTVMHGCAWHTEYCPINSRTFHGKSYANVFDDCFGCEHFLKLKETKSHENKSSVICFAAKQNKLLEKNIENITLICPKCNGKLIIKNGKFGKFYGCTNFPNCRYTQNI